jgi:hypothetical protein
MSVRSESTTALRGAVEELLAADFSQRRLVRYPKHDRVSRAWYLKRIGCKPTSRFAEDIFKKYDDLAHSAMRIDDTLIGRLDEYFERALANRTLAIKNGAVVRKRIGAVFGFPDTILDVPGIKARLDVWDARLPMDYRPDTRAITREDVERISNPPVSWSVFSTAVHEERNNTRSAGSKLREVLSEHLKTGAFIRGPSGRLARNEYAKLIGVHRDTISAHIHVIQEYERLAGPIESDVERKIPEIERWFEYLLSTNTVPLRKGKLLVAALMERFELSREKIEGSQILRDKIEEFNQTLLHRGYLGAKDAELYALLQKLLTKPKLGKDGYSFDRTRLSQTAGCSHGKLLRSPFRELIATAEDDHRANIERDRHWVCFPERAVDLGWLVRLGWSTEVVERICIVLKDRFSAATPIKRRRFCKEAGRFFKKLATQMTKSGRAAFLAINQRRSLADQDWREVLEALGKGGNRNSRAYINSIVDVFSSGGVLPVSSHRLKTKEKRQQKFGRPTLAEVAPTFPETAPKNVAPEPALVSTPVAAAAGQYVSFARWILLQKSSLTEEDGAAFRGDDFLAVLQSEVAGWDGELPKDPAQAISLIIKKRVALIHEAAKNIFDRWRSHYNEGQHLLSSGADPDEYEAILTAGRSADNYWQTLERYFPRANRVVGLANALRFFRERYDGIVPSQSEADHVVRLLSTRYCSRIDLQAYLVPHRDAVATALTLYLAESGCNIAVALGLFDDCIGEPDIYSFQKVTGYKERANGKRIDIDLPIDSVALDALRWLRDNNGVARAAAPKDVQGLLFLTHIQSSVSGINEAWFLHRFKRIIRAIPALERLPLTPAMIRPSVILCHALDNDGDLRVGLAFAQHDPNTTGVYQVRLPTKFIYDQLYARFQRRIETITLRMAEDLRAGQQPGLGAAARPIGIGGVCTIGGCGELNCWNNCSNLAVLPEVNA